MSDEYDEPARRGIAPLYIAGTIVATILALSAMKATFGIDVIGGLVDTIGFIPDRLAHDKNILDEFITYLSGLFDNRFN